jgi:hypothetical protein
MEPNFCNLFINLNSKGFPTTIAPHRLPALQSWVLSDHYTQPQPQREVAWQKLDVSQQEVPHQLHQHQQLVDEKQQEVQQTHQQW